MNPCGKKGYLKKGLLLSAAVLMMISCRVTKDYVRQAGMAQSGLYRDSLTADSVTIADIPWKEMFGDTLLLNLIQEGIANNLDLKIAMSRIKQAEANLAQKKASLYPFLDAHAGVTAQNPSDAARPPELFQLNGSASWEADIWGKLKSGRKAAVASLLQSDAYRKAVQTLLVSDIAAGYYQLLAYDAMMQVTLKTVRNRLQDVTTIRQLKESNVVNGAAVVQSEANMYSAEVTLPDISQNIRETENSLSILLGRNPGDIKRDSMDNQRINNSLMTGVPSQLLRNRPDVQEAEYQLIYYFELTNVAKAYFYPSLTITAEAGLSSLKFSQFFSASTLFSNLVAGLTQPIFNQRLNKQRLAVAQALQEEYLLNFKKTLLNAGLEVSNALYDYRMAADKIETRSKQIGFLQQSVDFTKELLKYTSNTNYMDVLTSEQNLLAAQLNGIHDQLQQLLAIVSLYRSLGGGWK